MKSITQINLAGLTARKSLSKSDSGILQALHIIAIGGAIFMPSYLTCLSIPGSKNCREMRLDVAGESCG